MNYNKSYQLLLKEADQLYKKYEVGRPEPFNVFSALQNKDGHLNEILHSRFLYALLDYKKPIEGTRENLKDFLQHVGIKNFELCDVKVEIESDGIDILIVNADKEAVAIENKINAGDQFEQLLRYYKKLEAEGYSVIHLLYLTPDGRDPTSDSVGDLDYEKISYEVLIPWLERCQKRAGDEPGLRESVAQYLWLIRRLTRTDFRGKYMDALKELCREDNNLYLIRDLHDAWSEAVLELRERLWSKIKSELESEIPELESIPPDAKDVRVSYKLGEASSLDIGGWSRIWFGVRSTKSKGEYAMLNRELKKYKVNEENEWYPWYRYADENLNLWNPTKEDLNLLKEKREEFVKKIVQEIKEFWEFVNAIK